MAGNPPLWLLRNTISPCGGRRLCKNREMWRAPVVIPPPPIITTTHRPEGTTWWYMGVKYGIRNSRVVKLESPMVITTSATPLNVAEGNLDKSDYFQWLGTKYFVDKGKGFSKCRACGFNCWIEAERQAHKEGCGKILQRAYKLLQRDKRCVICNQETGRKLYGLPICYSVQCEEEWRFGRPGHPDLPFCVQEAIQMASANL